MGSSPPHRQHIRRSRESLAGRLATPVRTNPIRIGSRQAPACGLLTRPRSAIRTTRPFSCSHDCEAASQAILIPLSLIAAVAATIASLALAWARNGAISGLLSGVLDHVRSLFGIG
jgi:hypothetical protein